MATPRQFPWELVSQVKDHRTMERLETAWDLSGYYAEMLTHLILQVNLDDLSFDPSERSFLRQCLADKDFLASKRQEKQILVGVSGATGAGKSTLLNALLDCEGLLSSSDGFASTATICEVGYNDEEDEDKALRCDVFYHDEAGMRKELDGYFRDRQARKELLEACPGKEGGGNLSSESWEEALKEADSNLQCVQDKIFALWGKSIDDLDGMSTGDLLRPDDPAMDFIRLQKQTVYGHDMSDFSEKIQRYLDSSQSEMEVARPEGWAQKMSLWPLIKMVKLYVKADILKCGIVLVDLPGLSDVVGARARLAEEYYGKLAVTMVVTPIVRGADEMTGVGLMSRSQAVNLKMDGKFDDKSFCVVLTKADVTDWPQSDRPSLAMVKKLNAEGKRLRAEKSRVEKEIKGLKKRRAKSKQKAQGLDLKVKIKEARKVLKTCRTAKKNHARDTRAKFGTAIFNYRRTRDKRLFAMINRVLQQHHNSMREISQGSLPAEFKHPRIFSVGTKAYWDLKSERAVEGYPSDRYTGIPGLRQWLKDVTIPIREKRTVASLKEYQGFYNSLQTWSDNVCMVRRVKFSAEEFEEQILNPMLEELQDLLEDELAEFDRDIRNCDPLLGYTAAIEKCQQELCQVVQSWARRYPSNKNRLQMINAMTFAAIIRRNGGPFTSNAGGKQTFYHWMEDLATLFNSQILGNWVKQLHEEIPNVVQRFGGRINETFVKWQERLMTATSQNCPDLESRHLLQQAAKLTVIKEEFKNSLSETVAKFVAESPTVRANLVNSMSTFWEPGFESADSVPSGPGVTKRKQEALLIFCRQHGEKTFKLPVAAVRRKIQRGLEKIKPGFHCALSKLLNSTRLQSQLFARNIAAGGTVHTTKGEKIKVEKMTDEAAGETAREGLVVHLRAACLRWSEAWQGQDFENLTATPDNSVPLEWSLGKDISPTEVSDSDIDSEDEDEDEDDAEDQGAAKVQDEDVFIIDEDDVIMNVNEVEVAATVGEDEATTAAIEEDAVMVGEDDAVTAVDEKDTVVDVSGEEVISTGNDQDAVMDANDEDAVMDTNQEDTVMDVNGEDAVMDVNGEDAVMDVNEEDAVIAIKEESVIREEDDMTTVKEEDVVTAVKEEGDASQERRWVFFSRQD